MINTVKRLAIVALMCIFASISVAQNDSGVDPAWTPQDELQNNDLVHPEDNETKEFEAGMDGDVDNIDAEHADPEIDLGHDQAGNFETEMDTNIDSENETIDRALDDF